jgi:formamidopyrimidine-DNA glycosylase
VPELPEVEVTRLGIEGPLRAARVTDVRVGKPLRWPFVPPAGGLAGRQLGGVLRRGKYLWLPLSALPDAGDEAGGLLLHLGMSGSLSLLPAPAPPAGAHDHFDLLTTAGTLRLTDPRRFGAVLWSAGLGAEPAAKLLEGLGAEPFDAALDAHAFHAALMRRRAPLKPVLLAGDVIVGAGNIYACEALFEAGIDPRLRANRLSRPRAARLLAAVRGTLERALAAGGTTLRDFRDVHGTAGAFQHAASVYGRAGQPCPRCGTAVRRIVQAQRATYFCPGCQRR